MNTKIGPQERPWYIKESIKYGRIKRPIGDDLYIVLKNAVEKILEFSPDVYSDETAVIYPAIEGAGEYIELATVKGALF